MALCESHGCTEYTNAGAAKIAGEERRERGYRQVEGRKLREAEDDLVSAALCRRNLAID